MWINLTDYILIYSSDDDCDKSNDTTQSINMCSEMDMNEASDMSYHTGYSSVASNSERCQNQKENSTTPVEPVTVNLSISYYICLIG